LGGDPIGADAIAAAIRFQWLPYTADELIAAKQNLSDEILAGGGEAGGEGCG